MHIMQDLKKTAGRKRKIKIRQGYIFKLHVKYQLYHYHLYSNKKLLNHKYLNCILLILTLFVTFVFLPTKSLGISITWSTVLLYLEINFMKQILSI